jgi:hypothetical protein
MVRCERDSVHQQHFSFLVFIVFSWRVNWLLPYWWAKNPCLLQWPDRRDSQVIILLKNIPIMKTYLHSNTNRVYDHFETACELGLNRWSPND